MSKKTPKTMVIAVRLPIEQREAIQTAAVTAGASVSGFVAATMAEAMSRKKAAPVAAAAPLPQIQRTQSGIALSDPAAIAELRRIGININQLAHAANAGYPPNVAALLDNLKRLFAMLSEPEVFKRHVVQFNGLAAEGRPSPEPRPSVGAAAPTTPSVPQRTTEPPQRRPSLPPGLAAAIAEAAAARPPQKLPARADAPKPAPSPPRLPPRPTPQPAMKDDRRAPQHPQARNQLQSRPELRPARPAEGDSGTGRLGIFRKLWDG